MNYLFLIWFGLLAIPATAASVPEPDSTVPPLNRSSMYLNVLVVRVGSDLKNFRALFSKVVSKRHEISAGIEFLFREPKALPPGSNCVSCIHGNPKDFIYGLNLSYAYLLYPSAKADWFRLALRSGIVIGGSAIRTNFQLRPVPIYGEDDYFKWDNEFRFDAGLLLYPMAEVIAARTVGLSGRAIRLSESTVLGGWHFI